MKLKLIIVFLFVCFGFQNQALAQNDQQQAAHYFQEGDFEKAAVFYEKLYNKDQSDFYFKYLLKCYNELHSYKDAEKLIRKQQKKNPGNLKYYVDLGILYKTTGEEAKSKKEFENALKELTATKNQITGLSYAFRDAGELDYAMKALEKGQKISNDMYDFHLEKAEIYNMQGKVQEMITEYLDFINEGANNLNVIESTLLTAINFEDPENPKMEILRTEILKRVQKEPDNQAYSELLIWFFQQKGDLAAAFNQIKAIDKRNREDGFRVYNFGLVCKSNENFDLAIKCFDYIITEKGKSSFYYIESKIDLVDVLFHKIVSIGIYENQDLISIEKSYVETLDELGKNAATINLLRGLAKIRAFYLHDIDGAITILSEAIQIPGLNKSTEANCKMDLADILLLQGDIWEASLYYSQVEKDFKHDPIGHDAKFRNAKISFYTGDFSWAQAQLDVLKASTSKLISNDAMQLSLLITDNMGMDTIPDAMKLFAEAELFAFQNKFDEAENKLDSLNGRFPWHALQDEQHYLRYKIQMKKRNYEKAAEELDFIITTYGTDILGDDAVFKLAELHQFYFKNDDKATEYYKKLMFDYPGSLYVVEARKRYRTLRGEKIN